jgi:S1-C subfamily serine protease
MEQLITNGKVSRGYLGVVIQTNTPAFAKENKLGAEHGAVVMEVDAKGPAGQSGLAEGDVVVGLNGTEIKTSDVFRNTIAMIKPGTTVDLAVVHQNGNKAVIKAKLGELPADNTRRRALKRPQLQPHRQ